MTGTDIAKSLDAELRTVSLEADGNAAFKDMQRQLNAVLGTNLEIDGYATLRINKGKDAGDISRLSNTQQAIAQFINEHAPELLDTKNLSVNDLLKAVENVAEPKLDLASIPEPENIGAAPVLATQVLQAEKQPSVTPLPENSANITVPGALQAATPENDVAAKTPALTQTAAVSVHDNTPPAIDTAPLGAPAVPVIMDNLAVTPAAQNMQEQRIPPDQPSAPEIDLVKASSTRSMGVSASRPDLSIFDKFIAENGLSTLTAASASVADPIPALNAAVQIEEALNAGQTQKAVQLTYDTTTSLLHEIGNLPALEALQEDLKTHAQKYGIDLSIESAMAPRVTTEIAAMPVIASSAADTPTLTSSTSTDVTSVSVADMMAPGIENVGDIPAMTSNGTNTARAQTSVAGLPAVSDGIKTAGRDLGTVFKNIVAMLTPAAPANAATAPSLEIDKQKMASTETPPSANAPSQKENPSSTAEAKLETPPAYDGWTNSDRGLALEAAMYLTSNEQYSLSDALKISNLIESRDYQNAFYGIKALMDHHLADGSYDDFADAVLIDHKTINEVGDTYGAGANLLYRIDEALLANGFPLMPDLQSGAVSTNLKDEDIRPDNPSSDLHSSVRLPEAFQAAQIPLADMGDYIQEASSVAANFTRKPMAMSA